MSIANPDIAEKIMHLLNIRMNEAYSFFYKHMKFRNQARLYLAIYHIEAHNMLCLFFKL